MDVTVSGEARAAAWFDLGTHGGEGRRQVSIDGGASPLGLGPLEAFVAIGVALLALPVLVVTLTGCGFAYLLRAFSGAGHG
jgi:hypothetical protein